MCKLALSLLSLPNEASPSSRSAVGRELLQARHQHHRHLRPRSPLRHGHRILIDLFDLCILIDHIPCESVDISIATLQEKKALSRSSGKQQHGFFTYKAAPTAATLHSCKSESRTVTPCIATPSRIAPTRVPDALPQILVNGQVDLISQPAAAKKCQLSM